MQMELISYRNMLKIIKETKSLGQFDLLANYKEDYKKLLDLGIIEKSLKRLCFFSIKENGLEIPFYKSSTKEEVLQHFSYDSYKHIVNQINNTIYAFSEGKYGTIGKY